MGNLTLFDIVASAILAVLLLTTVYNSSARMNEMLFTSGNEVIMQEHLVNIVRILEKDFRRIGYCSDQSQIPDVTQSIVSAGAHSISFLTDVNSDGVVDTLRYDVGTTSGLSSTPNPRDMLLKRYTKAAKQQAFSIGLTKFDFKYFDVNGDSLALPIADPTQIYNIQLTLALESTHPYNSQYSYVAWRQLRLKVCNLEDR